MISDKKNDFIVNTKFTIDEERNTLKLSDGEQGNALCLSGGGIRSAAFALGAIQAFAESGILARFHYLSTVSGGGYIGGWLTRLISSKYEEILLQSAATIKESREGDNAKNSESRGKNSVILREIEKLLTERENGFEMPELRGLRRYTNYLAPRLGPFSADVWAGIVLWVRNTLINWLVFGPLFLAISFLPLMYFMLISILGMVSPSWHYVVDHPEGMILIITIIPPIALPIILGKFLYRSIVELPSHSFPETLEPQQTRESYGKSGYYINRNIVRLVLIWSLLAPLAVMPILGLSPDTIKRDVEFIFNLPQQQEDDKSARILDQNIVNSCTTAGYACEGLPSRPVAVTTGPTGYAWTVSGIFFVLLLSAEIAYIMAWRHVRAFDFKGNESFKSSQLKPFRANFFSWFLASLMSSALYMIGVIFSFDSEARTVTIFGPIWVVMSELLRSTLYVALRTDALRGDLDREWSARLSGAMLKWALLYTLGAILVLLGPAYVLQFAGSWIAVASGGAASGTIVALLGKSAKTMLAARSMDGNPLIEKRIFINIFIVIFAASLTLIAGRSAELVTIFIYRHTTKLVNIRNNEVYYNSLIDFAFILSIILILTCFSWWLPNRLAARINLNNFSMHAVYRNRLVRAFLGSARNPDRWRPDQYTRFDPRDDVRMASAFEGRDPPALFPVVNVALNRTSGKDMARAERKAMAFTITPLRCGFAQPNDKEPDKGHFASTASYAGHELEFGPADDARGISVGTAITLSGAAASPNMGYHSSPLTAFVMTLFNVRLGAWLPNPAWPSATKEFLQTGDADGISPIIDEILGQSDDEDKYVYLSDGGHFDNLALYEMLRRRCRNIVVVDAGEDASYAYADLRMLIQRASIDFDIRVEFVSIQEVGEKNLRPSGTIAKVFYPQINEVDDHGRKLESIRHKEQSGTILYLKPWLASDAPIELRAFKILRPNFPHEPTSNQIYTEADFESYRQLGRHITRMALKSYSRDLHGTNKPLSEGDIEMDRLFSSLTREASSDR